MGHFCINVSSLAAPGEPQSLALPFLASDPACVPWPATISPQPLHLPSYPFYLTLTLLNQPLL
jgi:hypothetical protein